MRSKEKRRKWRSPRSISRAAISGAAPATESTPGRGRRGVKPGGDAVDAGGGKVAEAPSLDRGRVRFERDLDVAGEGPARSRALEQRRHGVGRHQRGRAAAKKDRRQLPARRFGGVMVELGEQGRLPARLVDRGADM